MGRSRLEVIIIGAGTGGLCLAQGLAADNVAVRVFERDRSPADRLQGYRLGISAGGSRALQSCLPDALFKKFVASSAKPSRSVSFLDHRLNRLLVIDLPRIRHATVDNDRPVSRVALRRVLLDGLDDVVHYGKRFIAFEDAPGGAVTAHFEDGSSATGDVLIGADGAGSRVRGQLLPQAKRVDTGIMIISGKLGLRESVRERTPPAIWRGPTLIFGSKGRFMFANAVEYEDAGRQPAAARNMDGCDINRDDFRSDDRDEYVMWGFSARREGFAPLRNLESFGGDDLKASVLALTEDWHPKVRYMVRRADASTVTAFPAKTSVPIPPWRTRNVTLLGDALHNMTPFRGIGANIALRDAAALRKALVAVDRGEQDLIPALAQYEREMIDYGFGAVRASLKEMERLHAENNLARAVTKTVFRAVDLIPPLKNAFHGSP